ncbi:dihydroorotase [Segatella albensis]|uniref:dihydroorotase n=1 Tax=Segatella albensis TaxID=77768 RepID=UPI000413AF70|nr:dihydroorotase [Segatella albensis]
MKILLKGGTIVNEGHSFVGDLVIENDHILEIINDGIARGNYDQIIDATGCFVLPGVIDEHVHFREPGLTRKADIESESRAAAFGGVTSFFDMPNTNPQTTSIETLEEKFSLGAEKSHVNYSFFIGATNDNAEVLRTVDATRVPGIKLFMGASTGNMLVDKMDSLREIFHIAKERNLPVMTHCEDTKLINENMKQAKEKYGEDPDVIHHAEIRSAEACYQSSSLAAQLANESGAHLHIAHISTADELTLADKNITLEACIAHLFFTDEDYAEKGTRIKCNPSIKSCTDRDAIRKALMDGRISCIGTDHAPHELKDKVGGCAHAASGMPMLQFSLVTMLELVDQGVLTIERLVELMSHQPARLFEVSRRGFLRPNYKADVVIVKKEPWTVSVDDIQSKCKWSPMEGHHYQWRVAYTICNGHIVYHKETLDESYRGEEIKFRA